MISSQADSALGSWEDISPDESYIEISESMLVAAEHVDAVIHEKIISVLHSMYSIPRSLSINVATTYLIYTLNGKGSAVSMKYLEDADFVAMIPIEIKKDQTNCSLKVLPDAQIFTCDLSMTMPFCHTKASSMHIVPRFSFWPFACRDCFRNLADNSDQRVHVPRGSAVILPARLLLERDINTYENRNKVSGRLEYDFLRYMQGSEYFLLSAFGLGDKGDSRIHAESQIVLSHGQVAGTCLSQIPANDRTYYGLHRKAKVIADEYLSLENKRLEQYVSSMNSRYDEFAGSCAVDLNTDIDQKNIDAELSIGTCSAPH